MKFHRPLLACVTLAASVSFVACASANTEWSYTFDSLKTGELIGQDDWKGYTPAPGVTELSPKITKSDDPARKLVLSQEAFEGKASSRARKSLPALYDGRGSLVLECDVRATAPNSIAVFGFGAESGFPATFGIQFDQFVVREVNFDGTTFAAMDPSGKRITPKRGDWYRLRSVWEKNVAGEWVASLAIRNLTKGETAFTTVYFDRGQNESTVRLNIGVDRPSKQFRLAVVRVGIPGGEIDNLSVTLQSR